jgi:membrane-bound metal-dependent hydrolase YbcI (DUF457 family)
MPSPIAHSILGFLVFRQVGRRRAWQRYPEPKQKAKLLTATVAFSLLPDLDAVAGFLAGDLAAFHNQWSHSFITGFVVALVLGSLMGIGGRGGFWKWFLLILACYELHVIADYFTYGRGVMLFWPLSLRRYVSPFSLFYGVRWSQGLFSLNHLWTLATEAVFGVGVYYLITRFEKIGSWFDKAKAAE